MTEEVVVESGSDWKRFIRKHWKIVAAFAVAGLLGFISAIYVFLWFTARRSNHWFSSLNFGSLVNSKCCVVYFAFDFLGTHIHWNSSNNRRNTGLAMVEKTL